MKLRRRRVLRRLRAFNSLDLFHAARVVARRSQRPRPSLPLPLGEPSLVPARRAMVSAQIPGRGRGYVAARSPVGLGVARAVSRTERLFRLGVHTVISV